MPRPQWTREQCRVFGRKGGRQRKGKAIRSADYNAGYSAGWKACERFWLKATKRAG